VWLRPPEQPLPDPVTWQGEDLMEAAMGSNAPLIILTPHLGCFEVIAQAYAQRCPHRMQKPQGLTRQPVQQSRFRSYNAYLSPS
jgi:KDO2-lipid IV(A) lauroyltransferase